MDNLTNEERAYLAGLIDGEGCIYIELDKKHKRGTCYHRLSVIITQANKTYLEYWRNKTDLGRVYRSRKDIYQWHCTDRSAEKLLGLIYDYLILKKDQADVALEFRKTSGQQHNGRHRMSDQLFKRRDELKNKLSALKQHGEFVSLEEPINHDSCFDQIRLF